MTTPQLFYKLVGSIFILSTLLSCQNIKKTDPLRIINNSLKAHGGIKKWEAVNQISYQKTTILYDSLGGCREKHCAET